MRFGRSVLTSTLLLACSLPGFALRHPRRGPTSQHRTHHSHHARIQKVRGQRSIDDARATQIQEALIKQGYLTGDATGHWDSKTEEAMQKLQADNGWQTKLVPDSRAIIKLGLGPKHDEQAQAYASYAGSNDSLVMQ